MSSDRRTREDAGAIEAESAPLRVERPLSGAESLQRSFGNARLVQMRAAVQRSPSTLPEWLQNIASVFPLKWLAQGFRSVFLPEGFAAAEPSGSWDHPLILLVTALWLVVGLAVVRLTFRWIRKDA